MEEEICRVCEEEVRDEHTYSVDSRSTKELKKAHKKS